MNRSLRVSFDFREEMDVFVDGADLNILEFDINKIRLQQGRLFLAVNNKNALRYECGDLPVGNCYTKTDICNYLKEAGLPYKVYSVYPCIEYPQLLYAEGCLPNED